jgi:hypothetical protein
MLVASLFLVVALEPATLRFTEVRPIPLKQTMSFRLSLAWLL